LLLLVCFLCWQGPYLHGKGGRMEEQKKSWGGAREGAGRKSTGEAGKSATITLRLSPGEKAALEQLAKAAGKSLTRYVLDRALEV